MAEQTFNIGFDGYWRHVNRNGIPKKPGVYCVYECFFNETEKTVSLIRLLYIGEAENVNERILNHEKYSDWNGKLQTGNIVCYSFAEISLYRDRVEAALIFEHKPICNSEFKNNFPFDRTTINISGRTSLLNTYFTVSRTD